VVFWFREETNKYDKNLSMLDGKPLYIPKWVECQLMQIHLHSDVIIQLLRRREPKFKFENYVNNMICKSEVIEKWDGVRSDTWSWLYNTDAPHQPI
jgi:hypothetical protein